MDAGSGSSRLRCRCPVRRSTRWPRRGSRLLRGGEGLVWSAWRSKTGHRLTEEILGLGEAVDVLDPDERCCTSTILTCQKCTQGSLTWRRCGYSHGSEAEDDGNGNFSLRIHLDVPDQENWKDAICPIRGGADGRVGICGGRHAVRVDARASRNGRLPEEGDRIALEQEEEEVEDAE